MNNRSIAYVFKLYSQLMELNGENTFRIRAIANASFKIDKLPIDATKVSLDELSSYPGIGKSTAERIMKIIETGTFPELEELKTIVPDGVIEMLNIKGVGPKKVKVIWQDLGIENIGELLYACNENRLKDAKGFGLKTQEEVKKSIEFKLAHQDWLLYAKAEPIAVEIYELLKSTISTDDRIEYTGDYRRKSETLNKIEFLTDTPLDILVKTLAEKDNPLQVNSLNTKSIRAQYQDSIAVEIYHSSKDEFAKNWILTTGSQSHIEKLTTPLPSGKSETAIYHSMKMEFIEPELREGYNEVELAKEHKLPTLITYEDIKGTLHNHSTYSDGVHSLEEMAVYCKNELKLEYFGICDHSQTAVYAGGLTIEKLQKQWEEIDKLNQKLAPFKIIKGIESDILSDGSLDYPSEVLAQFDFVVASVHSNLKMDKERATTRLITAIENPYTTILGHLTGRLLLSRPGYPLDFKKIIDACIDNQVVIEINANPLRLDLDWRWYPYALDKGAMLSINPDAHRKEGLLDMQYGIHVGRKGGLDAAHCLNSMSLAEIEKFFANKKNRN